MKTAVLPSVRVEPELRDNAERVLLPGENLSKFVEDAVKSLVSRRIQQKAFIERGLAARNHALETGIYYDADEVLDELDALYQQETGRS